MLIKSIINGKNYLKKKFRDWNKLKKMREKDNSSYKKKN